MEVTVGLLSDLMAGTAIGLSPALAWLTFYFTWRDKLRERRDEQKRRLIGLKEEVEYIGRWAGHAYDASSDSSNWRNPLWRVRDFPSSRISTFNLDTAPELGQHLSDTLVRFESAIARFRELLKEHQEFVQTAVETHKTGGPLASAWIEELYQKNKRIHVDGIGDAQPTGALHATWKDATTAIDKTMQDLAQQRGVPRFAMLGHGVAVALGLLGLGFLATFLVVLVGAMCS